MGAGRPAGAAGEAGYAVSSFRNVHVAAREDRPPPVHRAMTIEEVTDDTLEEWLGVRRIGNDITTPDAAAISDEWARAGLSDSLCNRA